MSKYEEIKQYLELSEFKSISQPESNTQIYRHKDGTVVIIEREVPII